MESQGNHTREPIFLSFQKEQVNSSNTNKFIYFTKFSLDQFLLEDSHTLSVTSMTATHG